MYRKLSGLVALATAAVLAASPALADPSVWRTQEWGATDFSKSSVDFAEILSGGPPKDGIPSIDAPEFVRLGEDAAAALDIGPMEPVVTVQIKGDARAYPVRILMWHEIVNDTVGGVPVTVTYCPLCNTALVFERRIGQTTYDFGTTGKLRHSDLVMYDRQTESWWQQYTGEAIVGEMTGTELTGVPARLESFERFAARHPEGQVLTAPRGFPRRYGANPYVGYDTASRPFLFRGELPDDIEPMARVVMVETEARTLAVSLEHLRERKRIELDDVVVTWEAGQNSALGASEIAEGRDVGNVVAQRRSGGGMEDIVHHVTFAFAYRAFVPDGEIVQAQP